MRRSQRRALVTGGGRGIGRAIALGLAADGADVVISYRRDEAAARETVAAIEHLGRRAAMLRADLAQTAEAEALAGAALDALGGIDVLVHNAGIASRGASVADTDPAEVERLFATHALGPFVLSKHLVPAMRDAPRGDVVMISSVAATLLPGWSAPYNMAKAAMEALAATLAKEERAHGIRVNVVAPGLVETEMGRRLVRATMGVDDIRQLDGASPFGRVCTPDDVADAVRFLVRTEYVSGARLPVDGGG